MADNHLHAIRSMGSDTTSQLNEIIMDEFGAKLNTAQTELAETETEVTRLIVGCQDEKHVTAKVTYLTKLANDMLELKQFDKNCYRMLP